MTGTELPSFIDPERARLARERRAARDWHELPKGYYAIPVYDWLKFGDEVTEDGADPEPELIGHQMFQRKVARQCKNGRVIGRNQFITGVSWTLPGADPDAVRREIEGDKRAAGDLAGWIRGIVDQVMLDIAGGDTYRKTYGQLTGKCGCCGKVLTDARSKLIGIGPDCRGYR